MILAIRTDAPTAHLHLYDGETTVEAFTWEAHRALAETITTQIEQLFARHKRGMRDITTIVVFEGPGSFTGLRIGISVANALGYSLDVPVIGVNETQWGELPKLPASNTQERTGVLPVYGSEPHITLPRK